MSLAELYTKDAKIWLPDSVLVWKCAALLEDYKGQTELGVRYDNGQIDKIKIKSSNDLPYLRNPEILIGENDLTSLSYLHEPAVLYNLQVRFCERNYIYTYCGIVLVAFNPYQQLPIYDNDTIHAYSGQDMASMDPHIFAVAEEAFKRMSRFEENQSIIVSGESGAGKTVSAKYAMRYFATVCGAEDETQIEKRVLATNPIMEAIGNAKTTRNDNSSRFGKYIQIGFSKNEHILGANMRTYLLEKSRVVFQAPEERNYHIFYQICSASNNEDIKEFELGHCEDFFYTNQGSSPLVDTINDSEDFFNTRQAMTMLGINKIRQNEIFRILAGILHLGNIEFKEDEKSSDSSFIPTTDGHLIAVAKLFGIDLEQIRYWLCNKKITTANEILTIPLTVAQVSFSRDALSKHIYSQLFLWIVNQLNKSLTSSIKMSKFIGVLDIYGFETFEINSFEQFCINYANEKLQQQFCLHVFKLEQEEYVREQIEWSFIDFYDNQPCIDLIESRLGILDLLDEECKMPKGSDKNWCRKLYEKHGKNKHFSKPRMSEEAFIIHHFADKVEYQMDGFLDKNRDTVLEEHINILKASEYELLAELFQEKSESPTGASRPGSRPLVRPAKEPPKSSQHLKQHRKTVGSQFSESLNLLMETLFSTTPHYVRCIKPNDGKLAFTFDAERAVQQLRACGVLETIRISAAGYPSRWTYPDFLKRYRVLAVSKNIVRNDVKKTCENILFKLISDKDKYQFGKSKIFFRAGQVAYLEKLRSDRLRACSILIQKIVRGWLARRRYKKVCKTVHLIQKFGRGLLARRHALFLRQSRASTIIRAAWLCYRCRRSFLKMKKSIVFIQSYGRALIGRQNFTMMHKSLKVMLIQRYVRGWLARRHFHRVQKGIVLMQAHIRRRLAKRQFKQLKIEARSVEHMKNVARGLENKIIELQQKLDEKVKENGLLREEQVQVLDLKNELVKLRGVKQSSTVMSNQIIELEDKIVLLTNQLENEKKEKDKISLEKENIKKEKDEIINALNQEKCWLKDQFEKVNQELLDNKNIQEDLIKQKVDESNAALKREFDLERSHHQKFVKDYARLQQRLDNIQSDLHLNTPNLHRRSPSNISNISLESESSGEKNDQDLGYYTSRKKEKELDQICHADSERHSTDDATKSNSEKVDKKEIPLLIRFQNKVKDLEKENAKFRLDLDRRDFNTSELVYGSVDRTIMDMYEAFKVQELETENANIKNELSRLQKAVTDGAVNFDLKGGKGKLAANQLIADQLEALREELRHKHDECVRLRTLLMKPRVTNEIKETIEVESTESTQLNEDGELTMAYETQKELNLLLENELQRLKQASIAREQDLCNQIDQLKNDSNRQRKIIDQNLSLCSETKLDATVHLEIIRLANENLKLHDEINKLQETVKKLKKALNIYAKRLKGTDVSDAKAELEREMAAEENLPAVKHHQLREFSGMLEYHKEDEQLLIRNLITDLKPETMLKEIPGLPANILFMCMRYTDYMNDDEKVRTLLTNAINSIKKVVKKNQNDPGTIIAWLANTSRLLNNLKQYSGEKTFQIKNSLRQNEQSLKNFDLSEYRQILNDLGVWIYQILIKLTESLIQPMIVGAVLENEAISGCSSGKPTGVRRASSKNQGQEDFQGFGPVSLITILDDIMQKLWANDVDSELVQQLFKQLFYFICANALNNLLLRKDLCHWMKGIQIRYNLTQLEQWLRDSKLQECSAQDALEPIIQATQLLQARKTDADVDSICDMCSRLTTPQIIKILNLYTPMNEFEERVPISFIRKVQEKMSGVKDSSQSLLMDTKYVYTVTFEFNYSPLKLEALSIPDEWGLGFLKKI